MALDPSKLLKPFPGDNPSGVDVDAEGQVAALEILAAGKPETQWSPAVLPDWNAVRRECEQVFASGQHLRVAVITTAALLQTEGLPGFITGLEVIEGLLTKFWPTVYPVLDASDRNNPIDRVLVVGGLAAPIGTLGDTLQIILTLRRTKLLQLPQIGAVTPAMLLAARGQAPALPDQPALDAAMADAALRGAGVENIGAILAQLQQASARLTAILAAFDSQAPDFQSPDFAPLERELESYRALLAPFAGVAASAAPNPAPASASAPVSAGVPASAGTGGIGEINSPEQVIRALDEICRFYETHQPASPLPLLIQRVRRLAKADFLTIVEDLAPDSVSQFKTATGFKEPPAAS